MFDPIPTEVDKYATGVLDAAFVVHKHLGPGLLESVYERCLSHELQKSGIPHDNQVSLPIEYDGLRIEGGLRLDIHVAQSLVVELKAVEKLLPLHEAQLYTYLKITKNRLGLLINFNVPLLKNGIKRIAN